MKKFIRYTFLSLAWIIIALTAVIVIALGVIQTKYFKEKLVSVIEKKAPDFINGKISIREISGDFFTRLVLKDLLLTSDSDTIAAVGELSAGYNLLPLLHGKISIENVSITNPYIHLVQLKDSSWNVQQIMKLPVQKGTGQDSTPVSKSMEVKLSSFKLSGGSIFIETPDTIIPKHVQGLVTELSLRIKDSLMSVNLQHLGFETREPDLMLRKLSLRLDKSPDFIKIADLICQTGQNQLEGKVDYFTDKKKRSAVLIKTAPLQLSEFKYYIPGFKTPASPVLNVDASMQHDSVFSNIELSDLKQVIHLEVVSPNLYRWIQKTDSLLVYRAKGSVEHLELMHWLESPELKYVLNGNFTAQGKGTDLKTAVVKIKGDFKDCVVERCSIHNLGFDLDYDRGDLQGSAEGDGNFGKFNLVSRIKDLLGTPVYNLSLETKDLDMAGLTGNDTLKTAVNMSAEIKGKGIDPKTLAAEAKITWGKSKVKDIAVDTLKALLVYEKQNLKVDSMRLKTQTISLNADGNYSLNSNSDFLLTADLTGMDELSSFIPLKDLQTSGHLDAHLYGRFDSLNIEANIELPHTEYGEYTLGKVILAAQAYLTPADTVINAHLKADELRTGDFKLDSLSANLEMAKDSVTIDGHLANKDLDSRFRTGIQLGELTKINLSDLSVKYKNQQWELDNPPAIVEIGTDSYKVSGFSLTNSKGDSAQYIIADGTINRKGTENFRLDIRNIDLKSIKELTGQDLPATGFLNFQVDLSGTADSPLLKGDFRLDEAVLNNYQFREFGGMFDYKNNRMDLDMTIIPKDSGDFKITGTVPMQLRMDSMNFKFDRNDPIAVNLEVAQFPLAVLGSIDMVKKVTGYIEGRVQMNGSVNAPELKGNMHLKNASLKIPEYGVDYKDILFDMNFLSDKVKIDTINIRTDKGMMTGTGQFNFSSDFYKGNISQSDIKLNFRNFKPVNHRQVNMQVNGKTTLGGTKDNLVFNGNLEVPQAEIYLPALFNMIGKANAPDIPKPLLVRALDSTMRSSDTLLVHKELDTAKVDSAKWDYFKNLKGKLRFKIPKNAWIKNESMYIEIMGDLELIKNQSFFELFGNVNVVRGQYELLGRKFKIDRGEINFQGGEEMMPVLNLEATYSFRNAQRQKQKLTVDIQGSPDSLAINFKLDEASINEGDALSYILFGKSLNELSLDQQEGVAAGGSGSLTETVAASLVSSQLSKFLGNKLNVDYIELKSEGGFGNATLTVGKYVTRDLFASYEKRFGQTDEKGQASYVVNLEYELFKFLFLQMNNSSIDNGFDVIFKLESK